MFMSWNLYFANWKLCMSCIALCGFQIAVVEFQACKSYWNASKSGIQRLGALLSVSTVKTLHPQYEHFSGLVQESPPHAQRTRKSKGHGRQIDIAVGVGGRICFLEFFNGCIAPNFFDKGMDFIFLFIRVTNHQHQFL